MQKNLRNEPFIDEDGAPEGAPIIVEGFEHGSLPTHLTAPDAKAAAAKQDGLVILYKAKELRITDQATLTQANEYLKQAKQIRAEIDKTFDPHIAQLHKSHKDLLAEKRRFTDPLEQAEKILRPAIGTYLHEQEQRALEADRARRRAEEEAERKANEATDLSHALIKNGDIEEAEKIASGAKVEVRQILDNRPEAVEDPITDNNQKRTTWHFEITDEAAIPREYLMVNETKIGQVVRAMKDQTNIPGVKAFPKRSVSTRI